MFTKEIPRFITVDDAGKAGLTLKPGWADIGRHYLIVRLEEAGMASEYMMMFEVVKQQLIVDGSTNAEARPNLNDNNTSNISVVDKPDSNFTSFSMRITMISP